MLSGIKMTVLTFGKALTKWLLAGLHNERLSTKKVVHIPWPLFMKYFM